MKNNKWAILSAIGFLGAAFNFFSIDACYFGSCNLNKYFIPLGIAFLVLLGFSMYKLVKESGRGTKQR